MAEDQLPADLPELTAAEIAAMESLGDDLVARLMAEADAEAKTNANSLRIRTLESLVTGTHPSVAPTMQRGATLIRATIDMRPIGGGEAEPCPVRLPDVWALVAMMSDEIERLRTGECRMCHQKIDCSREFCRECQQLA